MTKAYLNALSEMDKGFILEYLHKMDGEIDELRAQCAELKEVLEKLLVWADWQAKCRSPKTNEPNTGARESARAALAAIRALKDEP